MPAIQRRTLGVLSAAQIMAGMGVGVGLTLSTVVLDELSGSTVISGFARTATAVGAALLALPVAKVTGRAGRRAGMTLAYTAALTGCAISVAALSLRNWPLLLAGLILTAGGTTGGITARYAATDLSPQGHTARHLSLIAWTSTIGSVAGPNLAAPTDQIGRRIGLVAEAGPFAFAGLAFALALVIILVLLRPDPFTLARQLHGDKDSAAKRKGTINTAWQTLRITPMARRAMVMLVLTNTAMVSIMTMTPVKLHHDGSSLNVIGFVISLHIASMYVLSPVVGWLADKVGKLPVLVLGMALLLAAAVMVGTADHRIWQITTALIVLGLGWSCGTIAGSALVAESVPIDRRPDVQGLSSLLINVCAAAGTIVSSAIVGVLSYGFLGLAVGIMITLAALWLLTSRPGSTPEGHIQT
ncbi:MFS transporter [Nonomuraea sp. NPDC050643]|uniref:MFS transporter n=1 Tax=Nonomuraea sp. NPDC050643 TaxID=3155660 RepID=UPI0033EAE592